MSDPRERTDQKLRYARIQLDELEEYPDANSNDDWENAHQEGCFYHLCGAVEGLLHEIDEGYELGLALWDIKRPKVTQKLSQKKKGSAALDCLTALWNDKASWLSLLTELRNHGAHRRKPGRQIIASPGVPIDSRFLDPRTGAPQTVFPRLGCLQFLERILKEVEGLVEDCRKTDPELRYRRCE